MKKYLASVGSAQLLDQSGNHIADVRTLTDSSISIQTNMQDVVAGEGGKLYGRFNVGSTFRLQLTDALFDLNYFALQLGATIERGGDTTAFIVDNESHAYSTTLKFAHQPQKIGALCGLDKVVVWYKRGDSCGGTHADWQSIVLTSDQASDLAPTGEGLDASVFGMTSGDTFCFRYLFNTDKARRVLVGANFMPSEIIMLLTTKLFAADVGNAATAKAAGNITVKIPRFQLDGSMDLSMAMQQASTTNLSGVALAANTAGCDEDGMYAEIVEYSEEEWNRDTGLLELILDPDREAYAGAQSTDPKYVVYGVYMDHSIYKLPKEAITVTAHQASDPAPSPAKKYAYTNLSSTETSIVIYVDESTGKWYDKYGNPVED